MKNKVVHSQSGSSLIEILIAAGIMGFIALLMATMFANSFNDIRSLKESLALRDLETRARQILLRPDYASCLLRGRTLDTTVNPATWNPPIASLPIAYQIPAPAMPTACTEIGGSLAQVNAVIGDSMARIGMLAMPDTLDLGAGNYSETLAIAPDVQSLARSLREIRLPLQFRVDLASGAPNARPFLSVDLGAGAAALGPRPILELRCSEDNYLTGACSPGSCPIGWTELGQSSEITTNSNSVSAGYYSRHCEAPVGGGQLLELRCSEDNYLTGACSPGSCPSGWTEVGQSSAITANSNSISAGYYSRHCFKN